MQIILSFPSVAAIEVGISVFGFESNRRPDGDRSRNKSAGRASAKK
jgi:hypothetical protein